MKKTPWWKKAVIYQIYPRSFMDSNGDGIGDIPGIVSKLDYLRNLGIDAIWLSPVFRSPQDDNGYDISDYCDIDPLFGSLKDMERLFREAEKRNIHIILDLVLNHSSDEHPWFIEARKSRENAYHDYYVWRDGAEGMPPSDLQSCFGGSAWEWVPEVQQYYFHNFSRKQPDLNWENPVLRRELYDMIRWWVDRGAGGFRLDVIDHISKDPDTGTLVNGPRLHEFIREMRQEAFICEELVTVGEAWSADTEAAKLYSTPDGSELSMIFQFEHILLDQKPGGEKWDLAPLPLPALKSVMARWQKALHGQGWNSLFWENHDLPRIVSRWGDDGRYRIESAKMFAVLLFGMEGTPFIYQGQELGMTNAPLALSAYEDLETRNMIDIRKAMGFSDEEILRSAHAKSRDNARTPMQWNGEKNAGFTSGKPWLPVHPNYREVNVKNQIDDESSVFACYQKLIALRKKFDIFTEGDFRLLLPEDEAIFAYMRTKDEQELLVECSFSSQVIPDPLSDKEKGAEMLYGNWGANNRPGMLRPYEARMYLKTK